MWELPEQDEPKISKPKNLGLSNDFIAKNFNKYLEDGEDFEESEDSMYSSLDEVDSMQTMKSHPPNLEIQKDTNLQKLPSETEKCQNEIEETI